MLNLFKIYLFISIIIIPRTLFGQFDKLINYNVKDGLSSSEMYNILQDSKGYIWSCGDMGVSRFNGYEFKNFSTENGLPDNSVFAMYEDIKGRIWFEPFSCKLSFYQNDSIKELACNDTLGLIMKERFINSIYLDKGDTIWLGVTDSFYVKIYPGWRKNDLRKVKMPRGKYFFKVDDKGLIFGGSATDNYFITAYSNKGLHKLFEIDPKMKHKKKEYLRFYLIEMKDHSYLASINQRIIKFNSKGILHQADDETIVISLLEDNNNIITCSFNGVSFYSSDKIKFNKRINQLVDKIITGVCVDNGNGLWMTSEGQGLFYIPHRNFLYYTNQNGVSESKIVCIGHSDTNVVIGHLDGSMSILCSDNVYKIVSPKTTGNIAQSKRITSITNNNNKNNNNKRTIVTSMRGVYELNNKSLKLIPEFKNIAFKRIIKSRDGCFWGLNYGQLIKFEMKKSPNKIEAFLINARVDNIFEASNGSVWLSCPDGVRVYENGKINFLGLRDKLFKIRASEISEAADKSIWVATRGGGVIVKDGNKIIQITETDGLAGNMCRCLFIDSNIVWVGTNKGLSRILIGRNGTYNIDNFYAKNGLLTNEVNAILKHQGKLWLAHNSGVSVFDITNIKPNKYPPPIYIEKIFVNDTLSKKDNLMKLSYNQNYLTFHYIGLSYKDAGNIEYKYKMEGVDSNWIYSNHTNVSYFTLPSGSYRFLVAAKNNDGYWSSTPAAISFVILPPWWKTWTFIIASVLLIFILIGLIFIYRLDIIKKKERLKSLSQTRLANAELKALRAQMNPHFVFNAINSVQYFIINNDPISSQKYLSKFAKLIRYVVDNSKPSSIPLSRELEALNIYLDLESLRFENKFEYTIDVSNNVDIENVQIPSMLIQPYVENAIWHGLMHKDTKGKISIRIDLKEKALICEIEDNGIGRKKSQQIVKEKNGEFHKSVGMSITQERLDVLNQQNNSMLTVKIIDLEDEQGMAAGTRIELNLPFQ
ncbi:MAG: histidine kinase [Bacteroidota bacterium]|nr:histidine kinase [Bacteroidota bacterium]